MKRVFVIGYSENKGGVEKYIDLFSKYINANKVQVFLNLPIMEIDSRKWVRPKNRHNYLKYYLFWRKFFKVNHFDAIYYNTCDIVSIDMLRFAKKAGIPIRVIHSHSSKNQRQLNIFHQYQEKQSRVNLTKYATHFFACSKQAGEWMFGDGVDFKIIGNAIELQKYQYKIEKRQKIREEEQLQNKFVIGMVGRLEAEKNHEFALKVFERVHNAVPQSALIIAGEGSLRNSIEMQIEQMDLTNAVKLLGNRDNVAEILSAVDCFLMPSKFEGFPFAMVEAQAAGLPCIVSDQIPMETNISGNVHYISFDTPFDEWAKKNNGRRYCAKS